MNYNIKSLYCKKMYLPVNLGTMAHVWFQKFLNVGKTYICYELVANTKETYSFDQNLAASAGKSAANDLYAT